MSEKSRDIGSPRNGVTGYSELPNMGTGHSGPLLEQHVPLNSAPRPQKLTYSCIYNDNYISDGMVNEKIQLEN